MNEWTGLELFVGENSTDLPAFFSSTAICFYSTYARVPFLAAIEQKSALLVSFSSVHHCRKIAQHSQKTTPNNNCKQPHYSNSNQPPTNHCSPQQQTKASKAGSIHKQRHKTRLIALNVERG